MRNERSATTTGLAGKRSRRSGPPRSMASRACEQRGHRIAATRRSLRLKVDRPPPGCNPSAGETRISHEEPRVHAHPGGGSRLGDTIKGSRRRSEASVAMVLSRIPGKLVAQSRARGSCSGVCARARSPRPSLYDGSPAGRTNSDLRPIRADDGVATTGTAATVTATCGRRSTDLREDVAKYVEDRFP